MPKEISAHSVPRIKYSCGTPTGNLLVPYFQELMGVQAECTLPPAPERPAYPSTPTASTKEMVSKPWTIPLCSEGWLTPPSTCSYRYSLTYLIKPEKDTC